MASPNAMAGIFGQYHDARSLVLVEMGEVGFVDFARTRAIGTYGLNSCSVAIIASPYAAILAHIPPRPDFSTTDPFAGDDNARAMMAEVAHLYEMNRAKFPTAQCYIVSAVYNGVVALPDQLAIMQQAFLGMGLGVNVIYYDVPVNRNVRGEGTVVVVSYGLGTAPVVYVQDEPV